jgi:hypothetical protein
MSETHYPVANIWLPGVIDINTCEPLPQALVEIWSCNATGSYSSFTTAPPALAQPLPASTDELFTNSATRSAIIKSELENTTDNKTDEASQLNSCDHTYLSPSYL